MFKSPFCTLTFQKQRDLNIQLIYRVSQNDCNMEYLANISSWMNLIMLKFFLEDGPSKTLPKWYKQVSNDFPRRLKLKICAMIPTSGKLRKNHHVRQEGLRNQWKTEAVLRAGSSWNYLGDLRYLAGRHRTNPEFPGTDRSLAVLSDQDTEYSKTYAIFFISYKSQLEKMLES